MTIHRVTLFNVPKDEDIDFLLGQYQVLKQEALRDGKPYIQSVVAGRALPDDRSRGYTLVAKTTFSSLDDMKFYDNECGAHKRFKAHAGPRKVGDVLTVFFEHEAAA
ncbi:hypothetical protein M426DRAFT_321396 [Hypoxylon sp. CI-4A]|nr:hypothetical protein M426DRAFT_321396 [Hypoxylon sp. CI-4A]